MTSNYVFKGRVKKLALPVLSLIPYLGTFLRPPQSCSKLVKCFMADTPKRIMISPKSITSNSKMDNWYSRNQQPVFQNQVFGIWKTGLEIFSWITIFILRISVIDFGVSAIKICMICCAKILLCCLKSVIDFGDTSYQFRGYQ